MKKKTDPARLIPVGSVYLVSRYLLYWAAARSLGVKVGIAPFCVQT